jgi:tryptophanyl-tRNA synthetase
MTTARKTLVSGIQSSGKLHIGNYFGAIRQNIELGNSDAYDAYIFLADYHSMTSLTDAAERRNNTFDAACTYLAFGLDPEKVTLFKQSDVPEVHEFTWILNTVAPMPMLMLAHAFKDHDAKNKDVTVGLFDYPVLMASDILIYDGEVVPVGKDQEQHVEIARELAGKYNRAYGELLKMPQAFIKKDVATVPGIDGEKMSKSKNNHIPLFGSPPDIHKRIMSIVTDSARPEDKKNPDANTVYNIHKLFLNTEEDEILRAKFNDGGYGYKEAKEELLAVYTNWISSFEDTYHYYRSNPDEVYEILKKGGEKARGRAQEKMKHIRIATGLDK